MISLRLVYILASMNVSNVQHSGRYRSDNGREQVLVIMLNLLIAIMSDTYERVRENEMNTFLKTR